MKKTVIELENMEFYAFHGCYEQEKIVGNRFIVDLKFTVDATVAASSDNVADTVSYLDVYGVVKREMEITSDILENVADRILASLAGAFPAIESMSVKISKMTPPLGGQIERVSVAMDYVRC
ncbi:dihydroneopterin aldolase [uncultured Duncaniella sp.]|uniref:dihydroneopterin aldolase n=1 Tax=uncultured Duncaniella sp. TaxID=2768039 RepID=UPI0025B766BC|nr:dihydroneopterin aldolase [uncultured Duncaniella sp.]MCX4359444.1 dihydroneopterin aldolase [Rikenellaceae bacterium]